LYPELFSFFSIVTMSFVTLHHFHFPLLPSLNQSLRLSILSYSFLPQCCPFAR
jgi:hypothetical protein